MHDGIRKSAILLMTLGEDGAGNVLQHLSHEAVQTLGEAIATLQQVRHDEVNDVLEEFRQETEQYSAMHLDSGDYLRNALKKAMGAALAAVGDAAVWGALQPACAAAAVLAATVSWLFDFKFAALACALGYLALFNAPTLWLRWKGLSLGYDLGENLPAALQEWNWRRTVLRIRLAGFLCAAAAPALLLVREAGFVGWRSALAAAAFGAFFALRRAGWSSPAVYASCVTAAFGFRGVLALL